MVKGLIVLVLFFWQTISLLIGKIKGKDIASIFIFTYIISLPIEFSPTLIKTESATFQGTLGSEVKLYLPLILTLLYLPFIRNFRIININKIWGIAFVLLFVISLSMNNLQVKTGSLVALVFYLSHLTFLFIISSSTTKDNLITGIFNGFLVLSFLNIALSICFPLLDMIDVTTIIHEQGMVGATRMESRSGAIGLFAHPGNLSLFSSIAIIFFSSTYLNKHRKKLSRLLIIINICTLILTFSRASIIGLIFSIGIIFLSYRNPRIKFTSVSFFLRTIIPVSIIIFLLFVWLEPFNFLLSQSDVEIQYNNRLIHYFMAFNAFQESPFLGIGINSHLNYFDTNYNFISELTSDSFFATNPIHNIHLIVLIETGLIGVLVIYSFFISNIRNCYRVLQSNQNKILSLTQLGVISLIFVYGFVGWAPLSESILPFILMFTVFTIYDKKRSVEKTV